MTPRELDWRSARPKLRKIDDLVGTLRDYGDLSGDDLRSDRTRALAVERILTLLIELAFAINSHVAVARLRQAPDTYAESFALAQQTGLITAELAAAVRPAAGMRNILVHAYLDVDYDIVAAAIPLAIRHFGDYVRQAADWFGQHTEAQ